MDIKFDPVVMQRLEVSYNIGVKTERERIINLLIDLKAIRRDAFGDLVAFNISGDEVIYLPGLEKEK
jgi:hypothetical protein